MNAHIVRSMTDFLKIVQQESDSITRDNADDLLLFRGQNVDEPLLPKNARRHRLLREMGIPDRHDLHTMETMMLDEFKRRARPLLDKDPPNDWDWLTLAQHHGMETLLLDWTENPLVALHFALEPTQHHRQAMIVWMLRIDRAEIIVPSGEANPFQQRKTVIFKPNLVSKRLIAQSGWFSVHKYLKDRFVPLEKNRRFKRLLTKIQLNGDHVKIQRHLNMYGTNTASLFPDLDGLAKFINVQRELDNMYYIKMPEAKKT